MKKFVGGILITFSYLVGIAILFGCSRGIQRNSSTSIVLQVPGASQNGSSVGALASLPANRKACFGLNITASDIGSQPQTCGPNTGIVAGFVEPGGTIEVSVPKGSNRKFDLYLFLEAEGENVPCPSMATAWGGGVAIASTYLVGSIEGVELDDDVETLNIDATFPGTSTNLAQQLNLPSSCLPPPVPIPTVPPSSRFGVVIANGMATGGGMKLIGRVGVGPGAITATGSVYTIKPNRSP